MMSGDSERFLVVSPDWVGDAVMSLPALQFFRKEHPDAEITVLTQPKLAAFWKLCPAVDGFQTLEKTSGSLSRSHMILKTV